MYKKVRYLLDRWLTENFIAMIANHKLYSIISETEKRDKYSPKWHDVTQQIQQPN